MFRTLLALLCLIFSAPSAGICINAINVETGDYRSASWLFTEELSELWQKAFPETETGFSPTHTRNIEDRFSRLISKESRLVIAPLNGYVNQVMLSRPVKLVTLLWSVHLVPIDIGKQKEAVKLDNYKYWYVPTQSVIIPRLMNALGKTYFSEEFKSRFNELNANQGIIKEPDAEQPVSIPGFLGEQLQEDHISGGEQQAAANSINLSTANEESLAFQQSAELAGLGEFKTEVLEIETEMIPEIIEEYQEGILFFEMVGSIQHLKNAVRVPVPTTAFDQNIRDFLSSVHPWIQPFYNSRAGIQTLEFDMALFVHAEEETEFIENLLKLLSERIKSYFPPSYIFSNLTVQKTKEISPLFMHAGSLKFFDLD